MSISKFITRKAFPEGDFQNIRANAPNQMSYNIDATRDLVRNQPFNPYAPALAATMSLPYDVSQGIGRAFEGFEPDTGILDYDVVPNAPTFADIGKSIAAENPLDSLLGRTYGATLGLGDKLTDYAQGLKGLFDSSAMANEPMDGEDFLGTSTPRDLGTIEMAPSIKEAIYQDRIRQPNLPGFAYQPQYRIRDQLSRDFLQGGLFRDAKQGLGQTKNEFLEDISGLTRGLGSIKDKGMDFFGLAKDKGIDLGKTIASGIGRYALGPIGGILGSLIGSVKESPEQRAMKNFYGGEFGLDDIGRVQSGIMKGYSPVSMFGGVGLNQAIDKRIARINKTLAKQKKNRSKVLENRLKELKELRAKESAASSAALEAQRTGRRPGTGGDGGGVKDSGGPTGGYSYDSGGREGFGYGL